MPPRIRFKYASTSGAKPARVTLLGEITDWRNGLTLTEEADGTFMTDVELDAGAYAYKWLVDGSWQLDATNARTVGSTSGPNSVVVVEGAEEPFLFAPAPPFMVPLHGAGLRIFVGIRENALGANEDVTVRHREGDNAWIETKLTKVGSTIANAEHAYFTGQIPGSLRRIEVELVLRPARSGVFEMKRPSQRYRVPPWWREAVVYTVFVDRFRTSGDGTRWGESLRTTERCGGDLRGLIRALDTLASLGITCVHLTPVHLGESSHRYDFIDPRVIDPALGGEDAYAELIAAAHARGIRVLQDLSFAHASGNYGEARDVLERGERSPFASRFLWSTPNPNQPKTLLHYGARTCAPLMNLEHPDVHALVLETVDAYLARGVDGFRIDMAAEVPRPLANAIYERTMQKNPGAIVLGELVPAHAWRWRDSLTASTDFLFFEAIREIAKGERTLSSLPDRITNGDLFRGVDAREATMRMVSTHDHTRLATILARAGRRSQLPLFYLLLFTIPGVPMLLYGEELGLWSTAADDDIEDVWADRMPMPRSDASEGTATEVATESDRGSLRALIAQLTKLRRDHVAIRDGTLTWIYADDTTLVYRRQQGADVVDVALHFGNEPTALSLDDTSLPRATVEIASGTASFADDTAIMGEASALVLTRMERREDHDGHAIRARRNMAVVREDVLEARVAALSRPTRIDFAVTERCNLRCQHCITHAPEKTRAGTARTLTPETLAAIHDDLAFVQYFGFVHGGETLTAPIFWDVLAAIDAKRGKAAEADAPMIHLLSNGMRLTQPTIARLVASGVRSVSVSLDGASASTNDDIRVGGNFGNIVANLRAATAFCRRESVDMRFGISTVVMRQNVHELDDLVDLAIDIGVDWLKLEEAVGSTPFAAKSLLAVGDNAMLAAVERARLRGERRGLIVVNHISDPVRFVCQMTPAQAATHAADEFANRWHINPCATPWETACIEPSGEVRLGDFFGPILGRLADTTMVELWNAPAARTLREQSRRERVCQRVTCLREAR